MSLKPEPYHDSALVLRSDALAIFAEAVGLEASCATLSRLVDDLTFHDARASALTWLSRRMDVLTLARISRHRDLNILLASYYREAPEDISRRI